MIKSKNFINRKMDKKIDHTYQICNLCVMDTSDEDIVFDDKGVCNHCKEFNLILQQLDNRGENPPGLSVLFDKIRTKSKDRKYDCLIGISGGVDSCYTAYLAKKHGLRPLLLHMDNGWNSEIATRNVKNLVDHLQLDYESYVLNWDEFREVQLGFLKSSIVDLEMPTDIAIAASLYKTARKHKIPFIVSGGNYSGEGILPLTWGYHVMKDKKLYKHIVRKYASHH